MLLDFFLIVVIFVWIAEVFADGSITTGHAIFTLFALSIILGGLYRARHRPWLRHFFEIAFVLSVLLVFLIWQKGGDLSDVAVILLPLLFVLLAVFALYLLIHRLLPRSGDREGARREGTPREQSLLDFFLLVALFVWLAELYADGAIAVEHAAISLVGLAILLGLSRANKWLRGFLEIAFAVSVLLVFLIWQGGGDLREIGAILSPLFAVLLVFFGLYLMVGRVFGGRRDRK